MPITEKTQTVFETSDGQTFTDRDMALNHELLTRLEEFWEERGYSGMSKKEVADICLGHRKVLADIFFEFSNNGGR